MLISSINITRWPNESRILRSECGLEISPPVTLEPGDIIWIGKRKTTLEVDLYEHFAFADRS